MTWHRPDSDAAEATRAYLRGFERNREATCDAIGAIQKRLTDGSGSDYSILQPLFIDVQVLDRIYRDTELVARGMQQLARRRARQEGSWHLPYLRDDAAPIMPILTRFDGLLGDDGFKIIECNPQYHGGIPGGCDDMDLVGAAFEALEAMREVRRTFRIQPIANMERVFRSLSYVQARRGKSTPPVIGLIDISSEQPPPPFDGDVDFVLRFTSALMARGCRFHLCHARSLEYSQGVLHSEGQVLDLVSTGGGDPSQRDRVLGLFELGEDHPLVRALRDGAVASCDAFPLGGLLLPKALLADLHEAAAVGGLEPEVADAVQRTVPWTTRVRPGPVLHHGERRELRELMLARRDELVLKPSLGYGGRDVSLGWSCDADEWAKRVDEAMRAGTFVLQERARAPVAVVPKLSPGGGFDYLPMYSDLCPLVWADGHASGCLSRAAGNEVMNVSRGATMQPVFIVDGPTQR